MTTQKVIYAFIGLALIFVGYISYQNMVVIPREKMDLAERQAQRAKLDALLEQNRKELLLNQCMTEAFSNYSERWDNTCVSLGRAEDCNLPMVTASSYEDDRKEAQDRCVTMYK